jgi:hypothetical protein
MRALSKPINELTWSDVEAFCQLQITEGATLDYKREFPKKLECTVAAMANTLGGTILVGIADDDGKPVLPLVGVEAVRGLAEKVLNLCTDNISPPIIPGVQVCPNSAGDRAIVVVQIPQSRDAPHAIDSSTQVYVRTGQRNDPDALANLDRIEWMLGNRKKAEDFREWLIARANQRFWIAYNGHVPTIEKSQGLIAQTTTHGHLPCVLTISLVPTYPSREPLIEPGPLKRDLRKITVPDMMGTSREFPFLDGASPRLVEDGVVLHVGGRTERTYHTHTNIHGLYFHAQSLNYVLDKALEPKPTVIRLSEIVRRTRGMIDSAAKLYGLLNYSGPLHLRIRLERIMGYPLYINEPYDERKSYSIDPEIDAIELSSTQELTSHADHLTHRLVRRIGWAYNCDFSEADIANAMKR